MEKKTIDSKIEGVLQGESYAALRSSYDFVQALRSAVGRDLSEMSFSEFVLALAAVSATRLSN